jgi:hypothetical protein
MRLPQPIQQRAGVASLVRAAIDKQLNRRGYPGISSRRATCGGSPADPRPESIGNRDKWRKAPRYARHVVRVELKQWLNLKALGKKAKSLTISWSELQYSNPRPYVPDVNSKRKNQQKQWSLHSFEHVYRALLTRFLWSISGGAFPKPRSKPKPRPAD